jgi:hypothetical protein
MGVMRRVAALWRYDLLGVRLGVLALVLPVITATLVYTCRTRGLWVHPPDSRYYMTMAERNLGHEITTSIARARQVAAWRVSPWYFASNDPTWQMVKTRGLYPFLSMPPVVLWGLKAGSLVVPCLSILAFCFVTARVLQRLHGPAVAALVVGAFSLTATISGLIWATTDTLAMALAAVLVANLPIERRIGRANLVWLGAASMFLALTRQVGVLAPAMAACGWAWAAVRERRLANRWLGSLIVTAVVAGGAQLALTMVAHVDTQGIVARGQTTVGGVLRQFVRNLGTVTHQATQYMWTSDRLLFALLIAAALTALLRITKDLAAVFVGAVLSTYLLTAGVGFSASMRYEIILFPAAAVAFGGFVAWALSLRGSPFAAFDVPHPRDSDDSGAAPGTVWIPQLAGCATCLALLVVVSASGGSLSTAAAPASPSFDAAQGSQYYAVKPLAEPSAETTLKVALMQATKVAKDGGTLEGPFDWVHDLRYRPTGSGQPGWNRRGSDGTAVTRVNAMTDAEQMAFGDAVTFHRSVDVGTLQIERRQTSAYGQDVTFTVRDADGGLHTGTATTLYPIWNADESGLVTALVYAS